MDFQKMLKTKTGNKRDVKNQLQIYSMDKNSMKTMLIGSFSYKNFYASDVDLLEQIQKSDREKLINFFSNNILKIVNKMVLMSNQIFLEVKMGLNHFYYSIDIGYCDDNVYYMNKDLPQIVTTLFREKLINDEDNSVLIEIFQKDNFTQLDYEIVYYIFRNKYILRWNYNDLKKGYKILINEHNHAYKYRIEDAIVEKSNINIEGIFIDSNYQYVECSNFFVLEYNDRNGNKKLLNLPEKILIDKDAYFSENLKQAIYKSLYSKFKDYNPLKGAKRMFSYAKYFEIIPLMKKVYYITNSPYGLLYNINSQFKTILKAIPSNKFDINVATHQLDNIQWNIQNIALKDFDTLSIVKILQNLITPDQIIDIKYLSSELNKIISIISSYVNKKVLKILKEEKLYPLPNYLFPKNKPF